MSQLFISGMFRSGTTLLARMLHTHKSIACASDPYRPFFNCLRDSIAVEFGVDVDPYAPLGSYYADDQQRRLFDAVQSASLERQFDRDRETLLSRIRSHGQPFSPRIAENVNEIPGDSFADIYRTLLAEVPEQYGDGTESVTATKEVWTTEFIPALARSVSDSKFLLVVRDPRAVAASNNIEESRKYPWTFLARQWRKLATLTWAYNTDSELASRVQIVRYEDLVESPRQTATEICDFLDLGLDERILDPSNFIDGRGEQWLQNTSYDDGGASFNTDSVSKWQSVLDSKTVALLEQCCYATMEQFGYEFQESPTPGFEDETLVDPPVVTPPEMADWIRPYFEGRTQTTMRTELGSEYVRQRMLLSDQSVRERLDAETVRSYFLNERFFDQVRGRLNT